MTDKNFTSLARIIAALVSDLIQITPSSPLSIRRGAGGISLFLLHLLLNFPGFLLDLFQNGFALGGKIFWFFSRHSAILPCPGNRLLQNIA